MRIKHLYTVSLDPGYKKGVKSSQASPETGFDSSTFPVTGGFPFGGMGGGFHGEDDGILNS